MSTQPQSLALDLGLRDSPISSSQPLTTSHSQSSAHRVATEMFGPTHLGCFVLLEISAKGLARRNAIKGDGQLCVLILYPFHTLKQSWLQHILLEDIDLTNAIF